MKAEFRKTAYELFSIINCLIPKRNKILVYGDNERDNSEAIYKYLKRYRDYKITYVVKKGTLGQYENQDGCYIDSILRVTYEMMTSKVMIDSLLHQIKMKPTRNQLFLQLWHGSPLKALTKDGSNAMKMGSYYSKVSYAAELFKPHMTKTFGVNEQKMLLCGNPRNDYLFEDNGARIHFPYAGKRVIWMPTFRRGNHEKSSSKDIPIIDKNNITILDEVLKANEIKLYIKFHPLQLDAKTIIQQQALSNIEIIDDRMLREKDVPLYSFIGSMDALITDYSSVFFDYLLLNRPIGFAIDDFEEYDGARGFAFEDPLKYMPGEKLYSLEDMQAFLLHLKNGEDKHKEERERICKLTNHYVDNNNRQRITKLVDSVMQSNR